MAEHERIRDSKNGNETALAKTRFALNVNGSLLELATKLSNKEDEMSNRPCSGTSNLSVICNFRSVFKKDGFHFCANQRKRKAEDEVDAAERVKWKKCCLRTDENERQDFLSSSVPENETPELLAPATKVGSSNDAESAENNKRIIDKMENIKIMEKLLKNIREFNDPCKSISDRLNVQLPFEWSQLWLLMSCSKYLANDETSRAFDQKIVSCLGKSRINYASWKMTGKDFRLVEQMAIDHIVKNKSSDLECRLVLKLRKASRDIGVVSGESNFKTHKIPANSLSQLTWNGVVQRKFQCEHCTYQTDNRSHLLRHQSSIHNMFKPYHCYICTKEFSRVEYIKQHLISAHPGVKYDATRAKNELVFREQIQKQSQELRKADEFSSGIDWEPNHLKEKKNGSLQEFQLPRTDCTKVQKLNFYSEDVRNLLCPYCSFTAQDSADFLQHFEECRPNNDSFCCHICQERFLSRDYLQVHYANKHFTILYCCDLCPFFTTSLHTYDWHVAQLHFPRSQQNSCPICNRSFGKQSELVHHIESAHLKPLNYGGNVLISPSDRSWNSAGSMRFDDCLQGIQRARSGSGWQNGLSKNKY